ncbi:DUF2125 domain-containing protein [Stella sp.]|uniref:DUF2125 domain-containing protein n=1 Tax=Stella sp. TaxID=2912054 RepID=UPI0035B46873
MIRRSRILLLAGSLALAAAFGGYAWFWTWTADRILAGLPAWTGAMAADGVRVAHGPASVSGFPFAFRLSLPEPRIARAASYPAFRWSGDGLTATARPWRLAEWELAVPAPSRLELAAGRERWQGTVASGDGAFVADARGGTLVLDLRGIVGVERDPLSIGALRLRVAPDAARPAALAASVTAASVRLPAGVDAPLGREISVVAGKAALVERIPDLPPAAALAAWRRAGGTLDVEHFRIVWGEARVEGAFTAALDRDLQPILAGTAELAGHDAAIDALVGAGQLGRMEAFGIRALLAAVARPAASGDGAVVAAQFSVQDGRVSAGPVGTAPLRLFSLPRIAWPER